MNHHINNFFLIKNHAKVLGTENYKLARANHKSSIETPQKGNFEKKIPHSSLTKVSHLTGFPFPLSIRYMRGHPVLA